ncbi:hypothetical protein Dip510_000407 [Elusimicrobium posterum]|uniref:hypothetical protein n=1 Tax=Elusimicrobium posterum TaxID=3116653 RepID=UPI003C7798DD
MKKFFILFLASSALASFAHAGGVNKTSASQRLRSADSQVSSHQQQQSAKTELRASREAYYNFLNVIQEKDLSYTQKVSRAGIYAQAFLNEYNVIMKKDIYGSKDKQTVKAVKNNIAELYGFMIEQQQRAANNLKNRISSNDSDYRYSLYEKETVKRTLRYEIEDYYAPLETNYNLKLEAGDIKRMSLEEIKNLIALNAAVDNKKQEIIYLSTGFAQ